MHAQDGAKPSPHCALDKYASIDLTMDEDILVPVTLDGRAAFMVLEVGYGTTFIWDSFVKEAHIPANWVSNVFSEEEAPLFVATVQDFRLGPVRLGKALPQIVPPSWMGIAKPRTGGAPVVGILGMNALSKVDFELDIAHRKLNLFSPTHCPGRVVYWTHEFASAPLQRDSAGNTFVVMELEERKLEAMIRTARADTALEKGTARRLFGFDTGPGGAGDRYVAMKLTAPGLAAQNVRIDLTSTSTEDNTCALPVADSAGYRCAGYYPLQLGRNVLGALRLYFAVKEKTLYYTVADAN